MRKERVHASHGSPSELIQALPSIAKKSKVRESHLGFLRTYTVQGGKLVDASHSRPGGLNIDAISGFLVPSREPRATGIQRVQYNPELRSNLEGCALQ